MMPSLVPNRCAFLSFPSQAIILNPGIPLQLSHSCLVILSISPPNPPVA